MRHWEVDRFQWSWLLLLAAWLPLVAFAGDGAAASHQEASLLLTGSIVVNPDGSVARYAIDHADQVPAGARTVLDRLVPTWRFVPTQRNGKPVAVRADMSIRLLGHELPADKIAVEIAGASFTDPDAARIEIVSAPDANYPISAIKEGIAGTVYALMQIDASGTVVRSAIEQVNLQLLANDAQMKRWRKVFARAVTHAIDDARFAVPPVALGADGLAVVRMPFNFRIGRAGKPIYAAWTTYVPGPRNSVPWVKHDQRTERADLVPSGAVQWLAQQPFLKRVDNLN